jgi:hypothetical protein
MWSPQVPGVTVDPDAANRQMIELVSLARDNTVAERVVAGLIARSAESRRVVVLGAGPGSPDASP